MVSGQQNAFQKMSDFLAQQQEENGRLLHKLETSLGKHKRTNELMAAFTDNAVSDGKKAKASNGLLEARIQSYNG